MAIPETSSFIVGVRTNLLYGHIDEETRAENPRCISCDKDFQNADRVHQLACGHFGHRRCLNPIFFHGMPVLQLNVIQKKEERGRIQFVAEELDFRAEKICPRVDCQQPIQLNQATFDRTALLHEEIKALTPEEKMARALRDVQNGGQETKLIQEYLNTFSYPEDQLNTLEAPQRVDKCERAFTIGAIGAAAIAAFAFLVLNLDLKGIIL